MGRDIHARAAAQNPYQASIDTYAGEEFHAAVRAMIEATDEAATGAAPGLRERMHAAYRRAAQLEWMFWDSAYRQEQWPVWLRHGSREVAGISRKPLYRPRDGHNGTGPVAGRRARGDPKVTRH